MIKIDGSKFIDSSGGFLIDEKEVEAEEAERAAKLQKVIEEDQIEEVPLIYYKCVDCEEEFAESYLQKNFDFI